MIHITCTTPDSRMRGAFSDVRGAIAAVYTELEKQYGDAAPPSLTLQYFAVSHSAGTPDVLISEAA